MWLLVLVAAVAFWAVRAPGMEATKRYDTAVQQAEDRFEASDTSAEGVPEQDVVNGWYTNELLQVVISQNNRMIGHQAFPALYLLLFGGGFALDRAGTSLLKALGRRRP